MKSDIKKLRLPNSGDHRDDQTSQLLRRAYYQGKVTQFLTDDPDALAAVVAEQGAVLGDIRFMPRSRVPGWNRAQLERLMGARYRQLKALRNQNYRGGEIALVDLAGGLRQVETLLDEFGSVVSMCVCRDAGRCQRVLVVDEARRKLGVPAAELRPPSGPQTTLFDGRASV